MHCDEVREEGNRYKDEQREGKWWRGEEKKVKEGERNVRGRKGTRNWG